jgi:hypothetical protein
MGISSALTNELRKMVRSLNKMVAVGALAVGLALTGQASAFAAPAAAAVTVTPATGLSDGDTVTAAVTGFASGEKVFAMQCAHPTANVPVCNPVDASGTVVSANGSGSANVVVRKTYTGFTLDGKQYGPIDCATVPSGCGIIAVNEAMTTVAGANISFN